MKDQDKPALVLVTAPNRRVARKLARAALAERLVACANLVPAIESHYWWEGKIQTGTEVLILFKTTVRRLGGLERFVAARHPYDTPEFLVLSPSQGSRRYLDWVRASVGGQFPRRNLG